MKISITRKFVLGLGMLLLLGACSPPVEPVPEGAPEAPEAEEQPGQALAGDIPFSDAQPVLGTWMNWFDQNILIFIPEGEFIMGSLEQEDNPPRTVSLSSYWIYRYPVTNDMYRLCVATGACEEPATEPPYEDVFDPLRKDHPVRGVNWEQAAAYCGWMGAELPTEAQWEKAARGPDGDTYPWGSEDPSCSLLNYQGCVGDTTNVLAYYPDGMSTYELLDTAGNTFEWTRDWYQEDFFSTAPDVNPLGPDTGTYRSVRGSGFDSELDLLPLAHRAYLQPEKYRVDLGFRCVLTEPTYFAPYCEEVAYIPGVNKGPGPTPPGEPPEGGGGKCFAPKPYVEVTRGCANQGLNLGWAKLYPDPGVTINSAGGLNVSCDLNASPPLCLGPALDPFQMNVCTYCEEDIPVSVQPSCNQPWYHEEVDVNGDLMCVFDGYPAVPAQNCPNNWWLDPVSGYCIPIAIPVDPKCPEGFTYDPAMECCTATYIEPSGGWAGIPPNTYSACPVGYDFDPVNHVCTGLYHATGDFCIDYGSFVGPCGHDTNGGCDNPGQYGDQGSCEAASCKWNPKDTGVGYCSFP